MNRYKGLISVCAVVLGMLLLPVMGVAGGCDGIGNNPEWSAGLEQIIALNKNGEYDKSVETAKNMFEICADSPILLYYTGIALQGKGDAERATIYFQKASENLSKMAVEPGMSRKIWYQRYESEHPERTEQSVSELAAKNNAMTEEITKLQHQLSETSLKQDTSFLDVENRVVRNYRAIMWTGTGVGIAGLLVAVGGFLMVNYVDNTEDHGSSYRVRVPYQIGWALAGGGLGLTLAGAITAGIAGYHYTHFSLSKDVELSFDVSPVSAGLQLNF